jgi:hypothetical protein
LRFWIPTPPAERWSYCAFLRLTQWPSGGPGSTCRLATSSVVPQCVVILGCRRGLLMFGSVYAGGKKETREDKNMKFSSTHRAWGAGRLRPSDKASDKLGQFQLFFYSWTALDYSKSEKSLPLLLRSFSEVFMWEKTRNDRNTSLCSTQRAWGSGRVIA